MEPYKYTGEVHFVGQTQTFSSGFAKRVLVCKTQSENAKYPNYAMFEFTKGRGDGSKDRTKDLDGVNPGDKVEVSFYVDANENRNKAGQWFASLRAAKLEVRERAATACAAPPPAEPDGFADEGDIDDMPF